MKEVAELNSFDEQALKAKVQSILTTNGLDFRMEKVPMVAKFGEELLSSTYFGLVNTKTKEVLNTVKAGYTISQNDEVVELIVRGMKGFGELEVTKAGSLNGGRRTFVQLGIDGLAKVGDDSIRKYVTIIDSNDGSTALSVGIGDFTMSCSNQFFRFYKAGTMKMKHASSLQAKLAQLPSLIKLALDESMRQIAVYNKFQSTACSQAIIETFVNEMIGFNTESVGDSRRSPKSVTNMEALYKHITKETAQKGMNLWGLHSGVTSWSTHEKTSSKMLAKENGVMESLLVGSNYDTSIESFNYMVNLIGAKEMVLF